MKKLNILLFLIMGLGTLRSIAAAPPQDTTTTADRKKKKVLKLIAEVDSVEWFTNSLSAIIAPLNSGSIQKSKVKIINQELTKVDKSFNVLKGDLSTLTAFLTSDNERLNYNEHILNFNIQDSVMTDRVKALIAPENSPPYSAQIDYTENSVTSFINTTENLKLYLQALIPPVADSLLYKISARVDKTDDLLNNNTKLINDCVGDSKRQLQDAIDKVDNKEDRILKLLQPRTDSSFIVGFSVYNQELFGFFASALHRQTKRSRGNVFFRAGGSIAGILADI